MSTDIVDNLLNQWTNERPDVAPESLGVVVRILHLSKLLTESAGIALAELDLALWEYDVLSILLRQGPPFELSASELASESRLSTGAMTNRIDRLANKELVERLADAHDRRAVRVRLTGAGQKLTAAALKTRLRAADDSLRELGASERKDLAQLLRKLLICADSPN